MLRSKYGNTKQADRHYGCKITADQTCAATAKLSARPADIPRTLLTVVEAKISEHCTAGKFPEVYIGFPLARVSWVGG